MSKNTAQNLISGLYTALITPFLADSSIDWQGLENLLAQQLAAQVPAIVILGTTGESPTLSLAEKYAIIQFCRQYINDYSSSRGTSLGPKLSAPKPLLVVGTGSNCTMSSIKMTEEAEKLGADAAMIVAPYYNKPPQRGIYNHFHLIHENSSLPLIIYNIPGRSGINISNETIYEIVSKNPRVMGLKDATGDLVRPLELSVMLRQGMGNRDETKALPLSEAQLLFASTSSRQDNFSEQFTSEPPRLLQLAGDDSLTMAFYAQGGHGTISVASNLCPHTCVIWHNKLQQRKFDEAFTISQELSLIFRELFSDTNPIPVKYLAYRLGHTSTPELRPPLCAADESLAAKLDKVVNIIKNCEQKYSLLQKNLT